MRLNRVTEDQFSLIADSMYEELMMDEFVKILGLNPRLYTVTTGANSHENDGNLLPYRLDFSTQPAPKRKRSVVQKILKYATGEEIPRGAVYLSTVKQTETYDANSSLAEKDKWKKNWLVWHYFLVEVEE